MRTRLYLTLSILLCFVNLNCGGGSGGVSTPVIPPPPEPSYSLTASPSSVTITPSASGSVELSYTGTNGFSGTVTVTISGLPSGVIMTPSSPFVVPASGVQMNFSTTSAAIAGKYSLRMRATSGSITSDATLALTVAPSGAATGNRTSFVNTADTPSAVIYDPAHKLIYAALPNLERVAVVDPATQQVLRQIPVPDAVGMSMTPDGSRILVAGRAQQVVWISTATQEIVKRDILPLVEMQNCPTCSLSQLFVTQPMAMANGTVLFAGQTLWQGGIMSWIPGTSPITTLPQVGWIGGDTFGTRSADGSKAFFSSQGYPSTLVVYDASAGRLTYGNQSDYNAYNIAVNPNGSQIAVAEMSMDRIPRTSFYDGNLNLQGRRAENSGSSGMIYGPDGSTLYEVSVPGRAVPMIMAIDNSTYKTVSQAPALAPMIAGLGPVLESPSAMDASGLIFGAAYFGVALDDSTYVQNTAPENVGAVQFLFPATPSEGPLNAATNCTISVNPSLTGTVKAWFGQQSADFSVSSSSQLMGTVPASATAGPVNIKLLAADGTEGFLPAGFTYGAVFAEQPELAVPTTGGVPIQLFGYGFGLDLSTATQVKVGGQTAQLQSNSRAQNFPFPLSQINATAPAGNFGTATITVTSASGTATSPHQLHYVQVKDYPSSDSLQFILLDSKRQRLYLSAGNHINVFSLVSGTYASAIVPPTLKGTAHFLGLALTPDGSKLLAANYLDNSVAVLNPDNPSDATAVQIVPDGSSFTASGPLTLVATSTGHAFIGTGNKGGFTGPGAVLFDMDLASLTVVTKAVPVLCGAVDGTLLSSSRDGSKVFATPPGSGPSSGCIWSADTDTWIQGVDGSLLSDAVTSGDGNTFATINPSNAIYLLDSSVNNVAHVGRPSYISDKPALRGMKLNDAGSLVYVPVVLTSSNTDSAAPNGIDIYDAQRNELREQVVLSQTFIARQQVVGTQYMPIMGAMAIDPSGQNIYLLTTIGVTEVKLDTVPLSVGSVAPQLASAGSLVTLRGSGFAQSTAAMVNGNSATVSYVDASTMQLSVPATLSAGAVSVTLSNPGGDSYTLDAAFYVH